ncbi:prolyl aminopeptidase [Novosphingobium sp. Gsoil 351]|uniref:prolyl aminopeptidase n=1 Tax=Novosphingobium sp. Gsoil 351 TaxID=2675225 RepID=UPI0012B4ECF2|nr:prolyl aminopeptidase [Novosphingobium sp. Gsoil 351]QGN55492.1 prolyl aminopeptidase [Novosphingobium sp. Gsoil 351]
MSARSLYRVEPYACGMLAVGQGHELYWERCGTPGGKPAVFLHGGPGSGSSIESRGLFDPDRYDLLLFDQRGAGRSTPHANLVANTTWDLVEDIERLRRHAGVEEWLVFGGSWGSTLALAYAEAHPARVTELVLRGVFTGRQAELDWIYRGGADRLFPEAWRNFIEILTPEERADPCAGYYGRLTAADQTIQLAAARRWSEWEARIVQLEPDAALVESYTEEEFAVALARIEAHYMVNRLWLTEGQLLREAGRLCEISGIVVQGRYDACTPPRTAYDLCQVWPRARLEIVTAGHRFDEPPILNALISATDEFAE